MDQIIEQVISEVRKRHKRSLWGNMLLWLNEESSGDEEEEVKKPTRRPTKHSTKATIFSRPSVQSTRRAASKKSTRPSSRPMSSRPTATYRPSTQQDPSSPDSDGQKVSVLRRKSIATPIISDFRGQKPCTRIILGILQSFLYFPTA